MDINEKLKVLLLNEYDMHTETLSVLEGGFRSDETFILITSSQEKFVVKYIKCGKRFEYLEQILTFQNSLHDLYKYPCPEIVRTKNAQLILRDGERFVFVQTFIQGYEPSNVTIDNNHDYLYQMGRLLAQWRCASRQFNLNILIKDEEQEFTNDWWRKQNIGTNNQCLMSNFIECKNYFTNRNINFEIGLIHNDFHPNNSIMTDSGTIFIIDFIDACQSLFVADLSTSLFHLLLNKNIGFDRAKRFLSGYQQIQQLTIEEIDSLDMFVRLKLTMSIIDDLRYINDTNHPFIKSCFQLLEVLNENPTIVKSLL